jgi:predicted patatin/cPLA2 family phospholipase
LNKRTGEVRLFSNYDHPEFSPEQYSDWYRNGVLRAAKAHPLAYKEPVIVDGEQYVDGGFGYTLEDAVQQAVKDKATTIIVIDNENPTTIWDRYYAWRQPEPLRSTVRRCLSRPQALVPNYVELIHISPQGKLPADPLCKDPGKIEATIDAGKQAALEHPGLKEYLRKVA